MQVRNEKTPVVVERVVADIDEIVCLVRFPGWQHTAAGEREVRKALRKSLLKYQLHQDADLFERSYVYIRQYYNRDRGGICHQLANDAKVRWVK